MKTMKQIHPVRNALAQPEMRGRAVACRIPRYLDSVTTHDASGECDPREAGLTARDVETIWKHVLDLYRTGMYPAVSFCLRRNGRVVINRAVGHQRGNGPQDGPDAAKVLVTPETPFCWFSAAKAVTAMLIHLLAERGQIDLDDRVGRYIPEFASRGKHKVTIHHVLGHRGGFPTLPSGLRHDILYDFDACVSLICGLKHVSPHRTHVAYHAITGGYILGEIVRRVTGMTVRDFLQENIAGPLGLRYFRYGVAKEDRHKVALNYFTGFPLWFPVSYFTKKALGVAWEEAIRISNEPEFMDAIIPSANLYSTADEMNRFYQLLLNGGELDGVRIFRPATVREAVAEITPRRFDRTMMMPVPYSAGMILGGNPIGFYGLFSGHAFGHTGFTNCLSWADPARRISVVLLTSGKPLFGPHFLALGRLVTGISWHCPHDAPPV